MQMLFKQRIFSWFDSYDVYDEQGRTLFTVKGQLAWGHCLKIYDADGCEVGTVKEKVLSFLPRFEVYDANGYLGCIKKEFTLFKPQFTVDFGGWWVDGDLFEWDYRIHNAQGRIAAAVSKQLFHFTDTYVIDVADPKDALFALMLTLAIDAEKCSNN